MIALKQLIIAQPLHWLMLQPLLKLKPIVLLSIEHFLLFKRQHHQLEQPQQLVVQQEPLQLALQLLEWLSLELPFS